MRLRKSRWNHAFADLAQGGEFVGRKQGIEVCGSWLHDYRIKLLISAHFADGRVYTSPNAGRSIRRSEAAVDRVGASMAVARARALRKNLANAERLLRRALRQFKQASVHFRKQVPIGHYIADFACHRAVKIVVELTARCNQDAGSLSFPNPLPALGEGKDSHAPQSAHPIDWAPGLANYCAELFDPPESGRILLSFADNPGAGPMHKMNMSLPSGCRRVLSCRRPTSFAATEVLQGQVTSAKEGNMEGVLVTAKKDGATISTTVVSDDKGHYAFFLADRLEPGHYGIKIRAIGYILEGPRGRRSAGSRRHRLM